MTNLSPNEQALSFVAKSYAKGLITAANAYVTVTGLPGAAIGYMAGRTVGVIGGGAYKLGASLLNKCRTKQIETKSLHEYSMKPVKSCMKAGAILTTIASVAAKPTIGLGALALGAIAGTVYGLVKTPQIINEALAQGTSPTLKKMQINQKWLHQRIEKDETLGLRSAWENIKVIPSALREGVH